MNFLFVCGGTAGHINPALAIAGEIRRTNPDAKILFAGAGKELENRLIPHEGFHIVNIRMSGLRRDVSAESLRYNARTMRNLATAGIKAEELIRRFDPQVVVGTGGYICYPILRKAAQLCILTIVHESNAVPGLTTKLLSASVDRVLISFPELEGLYRHPERVFLTGTPVLGGFKPGVGQPADPAVDPASDTAADAAADLAASPERGDRRLVVSFWGSLGAERMNDMMADFIKLNAQAGLFDHIHAAGKKESADMMRSKLKKLGMPDVMPQGTSLVEYIHDMQSVMAAADLVMCRAGGSTIAELTVLGKPAVLIPSPYVTNNQQIKNAEQVEKAGGAVLLQERDCTGEMLFETVSDILKDKDKLSRMGDAQKALGAPDAAANIARMIMGLLRERSGR